jgi:hypothetical protein
VLADDPLVRMRAADALEKVCRRRPELVAPLTERLLAEAAAVDQPSVRWHVAQMLGELPLTAVQRDRAVALLLANLNPPVDWIVTACSLEALARLAQADPALEPVALTQLRRHAAGPRRAVAARARRMLRELGAPPGDGTDDPPRAGG